MRVQLFKAFLHALQCEPCSVSTPDAYKANIFGVCFVLWDFFSTEPRDWLGRTYEITYFVSSRVGRKTLLHRHLVFVTSSSVGERSI